MSWINQATETLDLIGKTLQKGVAVQNGQVVGDDFFIDVRSGQPRNNTLMYALGLGTFGIAIGAMVLSKRL